MLVSKLLKFIFFPLLHTTSLVAGFRFRVTSSKCLISEPPGSLFFFCFNIECQLVRLWMTCALIWSCMNQWLLFSTIHTYFSQTHLIAWLGGVPSKRLDLASADAAEPAFPAAPLRRCRRWSGAVVQDNCETYARTQSKFHTHNCEPRAGALRRFRLQTNSSYLVDPASSHMLVLKIKPCMSKYKHLYRETANGSLKQLWFI